MEALILRRNYPVPVTFADLRRAHNIAFDGYCDPSACHPGDRTAWHAVLKSATGATDDVYAVVDGCEVYLGRVAEDGIVDLIGDARGFRSVMIPLLMTKADEQGYWERPHEVRLDLQERAPSLKAIDAVVQRSQIEAEVRR